MESAMTVYADFMSYKSGIYKHTWGGMQGGHAIRIIGWGHDAASGINYWICANSWGDSWGEQGYFRIAFGECNIDSAVYGCVPAQSK